MSQVNATREYPNILGEAVTHKLLGLVNMAIKEYGIKNADAADILYSPEGDELRRNLTENLDRMLRSYIAKKEDTRNKVASCDKIKASDDQECFTRVKSKSVPDYDGFYTDYTMYQDCADPDHYVFVLGDNDLYGPESAEWDWETWDEEAANEWFDAYNGFEDEDEDEDDEEY